MAAEILRSVKNLGVTVTTMMMLQQKNITKTKTQEKKKKEENERPRRASNSGGGGGGGGGAGRREETKEKERESASTEILDREAVRELHQVEAWQKVRTYVRRLFADKDWHLTPTALEEMHQSYLSQAGLQPLGHLDLLAFNILVGKLSDSGVTPLRILESALLQMKPPPPLLPFERGFRIVQDAIETRVTEEVLQHMEEEEKKKTILQERFATQFQKYFRQETAKIIANHRDQKKKQQQQQSLDRLPGSYGRELAYAVAVVVSRRQFNEEESGDRDAYYELEPPLHRRVFRVYLDRVTRFITDDLYDVPLPPRSVLSPLRGTSPPPPPPLLQPPSKPDVRLSKDYDTKSPPYAPVSPDYAPVSPSYAPDVESLEYKPTRHSPNYHTWKQLRDLAEKEEEKKASKKKKDISPESKRGSPDYNVWKKTHGISSPKKEEDEQRRKTRPDFKYGGGGGGSVRPPDIPRRAPLRSSERKEEEKKAEEEKRHSNGGGGGEEKEDNRLSGGPVLGTIPITRDDVELRIKHHLEELKQSIELDISATLRQSQERKGNEKDKEWQDRVGWLVPGTRVANRWVIEAYIGYGGFGQVYRAVELFPSSSSSSNGGGPEDKKEEKKIKRNEKEQEEEKKKKKNKTVALKIAPLGAHAEQYKKFGLDREQVVEWSLQTELSEPAFQHPNLLPLIGATVATLLLRYTPGARELPHRLECLVMALPLALGNLNSALGRRPPPASLWATIELRDQCLAEVAAALSEKGQTKKTTEEREKRLAELGGTTTFLDPVLQIAACELQRLTHVEETLRFTRDMVCGMQRLHANRFVHRDFKPGNVLVNSADGTLMIADYGMSALDHLKRPNPTGRPADKVGTKEYRPLEAWCGTVANGIAFDYWTLGVTLLRVFYDLRPFDSTHQGATRTTLLLNIAKTVGWPPEMEQLFRSPTPPDNNTKKKKWDEELFRSCRLIDFDSFVSFTKRKQLSGREMSEEWLSTGAARGWASVYGEALYNASWDLIGDLLQMVPEKRSLKRAVALLERHGCTMRLIYTREIVTLKSTGEFRRSDGQHRQTRILAQHLWSRLLKDKKKPRPPVDDEREAELWRQALRMLAGKALEDVYPLWTQDRTPRHVMMQDHISETKASRIRHLERELFTRLDNDVWRGFLSPPEYVK